MRDVEVQLINNFSEIFGDYEVYFFGSRIDGRDIDLMIRHTQPLTLEDSDRWTQVHQWAVDNNQKIDCTFFANDSKDLWIATAEYFNEHGTIEDTSWVHQWSKIKFPTKTEVTRPYNTWERVVGNIWRCNVGEDWNFIPNKFIERGFISLYPERAVI